MDGMNGTELHEWAHEDHGNVDPAHNGIDMRRDPTERALIENGRIRDKVRAELAAHAREFQRVFMANRLLVPRQSLQTLAEWNADEQYGHEWCLNAARTDEELIAVYQTQLADYAVTKERLALERILRDDAQKQISAQKAQLVQAESNLNATQKMLDATIAERDELHVQIMALMTERDTLAAKLDAANEKLAARENAALVADATDVCAGFSAAALYRMYTLEKRISEERRRAVERLTARLNGAQIAADIGLDDAHEDDDATPATLGDRRQQETRSIEWMPPTRSKPDAAA